MTVWAARLASRLTNFFLGVRWSSSYASSSKVWESLGLRPLWRALFQVPPKVAEPQTVIVRLQIGAHQIEKQHINTTRDEQLLREHIRAGSSRDVFHASIIAPARLFFAHLGIAELSRGV